MLWKGCAATTTMSCAHLRHNRVIDGKRDKGKLPTWIFEPSFVADPTHRKKVVSKKFFDLAYATVAKSRVSIAIAKRMKTNWGNLIKQNRGNSIETFVQNAKAPLEHIFNNHQYCDAQWCLALKAQKENKVYVHEQGWLSCEKDAKIYEDLHAVTSKYGAPFYLEQSRHPFDTQSNEALNQSQICLTPKNKVFHSTPSFNYRHAIVVASHNWGYGKFWSSVMDELGVHYSQIFSSHCGNVERKRKSWKEWHSKFETKR